LNILLSIEEKTVQITVKKSGLFAYLKSIS